MALINIGTLILPKYWSLYTFFSTSYLYLKSLTLHSHSPSLLSTSSSPSLGSTYSGHRFNQILFNLRENYFPNSVSPSSYSQPISWLASHPDFWKVRCTLSICFSIFSWLLQAVSIWLLIKLISENLKAFIFQILFSWTSHFTGQCWCLLPGVFVLMWS